MFKNRRLYALLLVFAMLFSFTSVFADDEVVVADEISIVFEETYTDNVYNINLTSNQGIINKFLAAQFTFELDAENTSYRIKAANGVSFTRSADTYAFYIVKGLSGESITIATVTFSGDGDYAFKVSSDEAQVQATSLTNNLIISYEQGAEYNLITDDVIIYESAVNLDSDTVSEQEPTEEPTKEPEATEEPTKAPESADSLVIEMADITPEPTYAPQIVQSVPEQEQSDISETDTGNTEEVSTATESNEDVEISNTSSTDYSISYTGFSYSRDYSTNDEMYSISVNTANNTSVSTDCAVIAAIYTEDGLLKNMSKQELKLYGNSTNSLIFNIDSNAIAGVANRIKVFLWKADSMIPLCDSLVIDTGL